MTDLSLAPLAKFSPVADGVGRLAVVFVNVYVVDLPGGEFVLIDTALPGTAGFVRMAIADRYGPDARPSAIVLTHAHFDHAGNARTFADEWNVPVYVGEKELPYVTGRSDYAPADPTPGGAICAMSRAMPKGGIDLGGRARGLPADGTVPPLPGWRWVATPGHTAGHVSFVRESDGVAIVGDALATFDMDSWAAQATWPRQLARPATPFTPDWIAARQSIRALADARPSLVAAGHGLPIDGDDLPERLAAFAEAMREPTGGRYADGHPAEYDADGALASVPPPVPDPKKFELMAGAALLGVLTAGVAAYVASRTPPERRAEVVGRARSFLGDMGVRL